MAETVISGKDPAISVVIPCFRAGELLAEAIESVLAQTEQDWELILVDNNASEETRAVINRYVERYPKKIRSVLEKNQGNSSARNRGITEAKGVYIALLDDDDMMYPNRLSKQLEAMEGSPEVSLVYGLLDIVSFDGQTIVEKNKVDLPGAWSTSLFGDHPRFKLDPLVEPRPSVTFFRKDRAIEAGLFDERFNPFFVEETDFYLRMWDLGPFKLVPEAVIAFRLPSPAFLNKKRTGNTNSLMAKRNLSLFFSKLVEKYYRKNDQNIRRKFHKIQSQWLRELSMDVFGCRDGRRIGRSLLLRALWANPTDPKNWKWFLRSYLSDKKLLNALNLQEFSPHLLSEMTDQEKLGEFFRLPDNV